MQHSVVNNAMCKRVSSILLNFSTMKDMKKMKGRVMSCFRCDCHQDSVDGFILNHEGHEEHEV